MHGGRVGEHRPGVVLVVVLAGEPLPRDGRASKPPRPQPVGDRAGASSSSYSTARTVTTAPPRSPGPASPARPRPARCAPARRRPPGRAPAGSPAAIQPRMPSTADPLEDRHGVQHLRARSTPPPYVAAISSSRRATSAAGARPEQRHAGPGEVGELEAAGWSGRPGPSRRRRRAGRPRSTRCTARRRCARAGARRRRGRTARARSSSKPSTASCSSRVQRVRSDQLRVGEQRRRRRRRPCPGR